MGEYDKYGQYRHSDGTVSSPHLGTGNRSEQRLAGVNEWDSPIGIESKVRSFREAHGMDPYTGVSKYPSASGGAWVGSVFLKWAFLLVVVLASVMLWERSESQRLAFAVAIEAWGLDKALAGEDFAPLSAYKEYIPKKAAVDVSPKDLNAKAKELFASPGRATDRAIAHWGPAAWSCLRENPICIADAGARERDARDIRLLGLMFLEIAKRKGSPDAGADIGLYMMSKDAPLGKDPRLAKAHWANCLYDNRNAKRCARLLGRATSPWAIITAKVASFIRASVR